LDTTRNDIVATHSVVRVASLDAIAAALALRGPPPDFMTLRGGMRAALVSGPDGHRFLVEERVRDCRRVPGEGGPYGGAQSRQPPGGTQP
jgi:hypothetical protein